MTTVAFMAADHASSWLGGRNYLRNLLRALATTPGVGVSPLVVVSRQDRAPREDFPGARIVRARALTARSPLLVARAGSRRLLQVDPLVEYLVRRHDVRVVSHVLAAVRFSSVPVISWIPDFQHAHLPQLFSKRDIAARDSSFLRAARHATRIIVSSQVAKEDFEGRFPWAAERCDVLHFVASTDSLPREEPLAAIERRYGFSGPFFFLPGQFWQHKNHEVVIAALEILKARGRAPLVLASGSTQDHRRPEFFDSLMRRCAERGLTQSFRALGVVPYEHVVGLMKNCVAVLQPSLFEGWSTVVEEARSLGKQILLSEIPVHCEQAPPRGVFFPARDAEALAGRIEAALSSFDLAAEARHMQEAARDLPRRRDEFARTYAEIVTRALRA